MGVSTDGILFYGWLFDEGHEFPWTERRDGDEEEWWMKANGYEPPFQLFDERGEYLDGREPSAAERREYWDHWHKWKEEHPMPFKVENYCSDGCPMYAIVVKSITANRGYPVEVDPDSFSVDRWKVMEAEEACAKHGIELDGEPKWWLASYWG